MKRLIMISVIFASPMFQASSIYGGEEETQDNSISLDQSDSGTIPEKSYANRYDDGYASQPADGSPAAAPTDIPTPAEGSGNPDVDGLHEGNLDTTGIDINGSGNWLKKRIIYQQAQTEFDEVLESVSKVVDMRMQFSNEVSAIGHKIDEFYETVDFDKGQLDDKFKEILAALDVEQKLRGDLSEKERELQTAIKQQMTSIDQLGRNIKSIGDLDSKIDQTLMQAFKTIDECRDYEAKAWTTFKLIGKEIDDKKARNLYYEINNFKQNIDQKSNYLSSSLLPYLHNVLVAKIESNISKINDSIAQLKQKGIDLVAIMKSEQESDVAEIKKREDEQAALAVEKALELEREKEAQDKKEEALALKKKQESTWSYWLYHSLGFDYFGKMFESYKYPVASYVYKELIIFKDFMHSCVENLMGYFKTTPKKKNKPVAVEEVATGQAEQAPVETPEVQDVAKSDAQESDVVQPSDAPDDVQ